MSVSVDLLTVPAKFRRNHVTPIDALVPAIGRAADRVRFVGLSNLAESLIVGRMFENEYDLPKHMLINRSILAQAFDDCSCSITGDFERPDL